MEVLERAKMKDGTRIQIENWKNDYDFIKTLNIAVYPIAQRGSEANKTFRLELENFESDAEVEEIFNRLERGKIELAELTNYFRNGTKDEYLLGIDSNKKIEGGNLKMENKELKYVYDHVSLIPGKMDEKKAKETTEKFKNFFENNNIKIKEFNELGKRKLAYEIRGEQEAYYIGVKFVGKPNDVADLERYVRTNDNFIKFITVKLDEEQQDYEDEEEEEL